MDSSAAAQMRNIHEVWAELHPIFPDSITQWFVLFRVPTPLNIDFES